MLMFQRTPTVLLYHGTPLQARRPDEIEANSFEQHVAFLSRKFEIVSAEYGSGSPERKRARVVLTFDDGFRNNADIAVPILRKYNVQATFFVSSRHSEPGKYLWFTYFRMLFRYFPDEVLPFRRRSLNMSTQFRRHSVHLLMDHLLRMRPHPQSIYD